MILRNEFEVAAPVEKVWAYLLDVPNLAPCLPGATLVGDDGSGTYQGKVVAKLGLVRLNFSGTATIVKADEAGRRLVLRASGSEDTGKGTVEMTITSTLVPAGRGTKVTISQDLTVSGAAAQFGRGLFSDVTSVLMGSFVDCFQHNIDNQGSGGGTATAVRAAKPVSGFGIGLRATLMALKRVFARFFLPYDATRRF